jgi:tryptophan halogenase
MAVPDSLREKMELFRTRGATIFPNQTIFQEPNWLAIMMGQAGEPEGYDPLADLMDERLMAERLQQVRIACLQAVERMPTHAQALARLVGAKGKSDVEIA